MAALAASIAVLASAPAAQGAFQWHDGQVQKSTITNCGSIIFGSPYQEEGAWTWGGFYADLAAGQPSVGETFYIHVVFAAVGNSCSGHRAHVELPPNLSPAITGGTPVFCYALNYNNNPPTAAQEPPPPGGYCRQTPSATVYGHGLSLDLAPGSGQPADTYPFAQGYGWELQVPVTAGSTFNAVCPAGCFKFGVKLFDGNSSPLLFPEAPLLVDNVAGGGGTPGGGGGTGGAGGGLTPNPQRPAPPAATPTAAPTPIAAPPKKCKKGQKLKKGKCVKKRKKK